MLSQRPGELLCVFSEDTCDWVDVDGVDVEGLPFAPEVLAEDSAPIIDDVSRWITEGIPFVEDFSHNADA